MDEQHAEPEVPVRPVSDVPTLTELLRAVGYLTIVPVPARVGGEPLARAALFFPLVGLLIGGLLVGFDWLLGGLPGSLRSSTLAGVLVGVSGGAHVMDTARVAGALGRGREAALALMRRRSVNRQGWIGACLVLVAAVLCVRALDTTRLWGLLLAPMLGRWSMVVCGYSARVPRGWTSALARPRGVTFREFALASVFTLAVTFSLSEAVGILVAAGVALFTVGLRLLWHRWLDGVTDTIIGVTGAGAELLALALFSLF